ncbi:FR47-like protein [Hyunsoonleella jejuensis]|uniref:FR47-like protein n=1 Tax=Hyunsoonleella jejuensis TaxID=419940 RepID=A0A1H9CZC8_9FLAO|nr:GNAT family N-acetyltransferase [Hyunsoonleella jejuensis]SEQ06596.1 FR47-like protein [Hyunsoonleella jejuensis]
MNHFQQTLQNPVWYALKETHQKYVVAYDEVKFYNPNICPFGAFPNASKTKKALTAYSKLTDSFFLVSENDTPDFDEHHVVLNQKIEGCQMVLNDLATVEISETIVPLTETYIQEIYDLIWLVMPGYYKKRTFDMGDYFGIFKHGKLIAISGQRMQTNDFIEVSGVVTHPDFTRQGFAKQLITHTVQEILKTGKHPILHTTKGNPAIGLYESLGFQLTRDMNWWWFRSK